MSGEYSIFIKTVLDNPKAIGTAFPASNHLASKLVEDIDFNRTDKVLELNPSTGILSRQLLSKLATQDQYLAIEQDSAFADLLKDNLPFTDFETGTTDDIQNHLKARNWENLDYVFSGRAFNTQDDQDTQHLLENIASACNEGAKFTTFQYLHSYKFAKAEQFRWLAQETFGPLIQTKLVLINLFPAFVFTWEKKASSEEAPVCIEGKEVDDEKEVK